MFFLNELTLTYVFSFQPKQQQQKPKCDFGAVLASNITNNNSQSTTNNNILFQLRKNLATELAKIKKNS